GPFGDRLAAWRGAALAGDGELAPGLRSLSPSDFGFHNALATPGGAPVFIDFEYFGWDDPAKLVSDMLWHPGMNLADELGARFRAGATELYAAGDAGFASRLARLHSLYALRWCMIILNEFLPERWAVRAHAGAADRAQAKRRQLALAERMLARADQTRGTR
ncbi:MAG: hypothetical protein HQL40_05370, partial [Alphaproteobacteria bacterium]|nr:hypothetical protein [Alphaproteobacteria bacterium]